MAEKSRIEVLEEKILKYEKALREKDDTIEKLQQEVAKLESSSIIERIINM